MSEDFNTGEFKQGQHIVYPLQGVGIIKEIQKLDFKEKPTPYYVMYFEASDMTISIPVENTTQQGIRAIVDSEESLKALEIIDKDFEPVPTDWKLRYQMNLELLKSGSIQDIATVVTRLYHRSKVKDLPIQERKLYEIALQLLIDEVSFSLGKKKDEIEEMIFMKLESEPRESFDEDEMEHDILPSHHDDLNHEIDDEDES